MQAEPRDRLAPEVARREAAHRRTLLLALAALLLLSISPLFGHHLLIGLDGRLAGHDHLWALCLVALHAILGPVHGAFHLLFFAGLGYALWDRVRAWRSARRALASVIALRPAPGDAFWRAAGAADIAPTRVRVVAGLPTPAFTFGWFRPRIYVAAALAERLPHDELAAVLAHEGAHVRRRDPLRLSALRFLACVLFWLPAVRRLSEDYAAEGEVWADDAAAARHGTALLSALLRLVEWNAPALRAPGVGLYGGDLFERRVLRLSGVAVPPHSRLTRRSLLGATAALLLVWSSGLAVLHPMPDAHAAHCEHRGVAAVLHLFCASARLHDPAVPCPHRSAAR